jgi:hypothetical protein
MAYHRCEQVRCSASIEFTVTQTTAMLPVTKHVLEINWDAKRHEEVTRYSLRHLRNWELKRRVRRIYPAIVSNRSCVYRGGVNRDMFVLDIMTGLWPSEAKRTSYACAEHDSSSSIHTSQKVRRNPHYDRYSLQRDLRTLMRNSRKMYNCSILNYAIYEREGWGCTR